MIPVWTIHYAPPVVASIRRNGIAVSYNEILRRLEDAETTTVAVCKTCDGSGKVLAREQPCQDCKGVDDE